MTREPLGGQPERGCRPSIVDFDYQLKYQRAFEAILWSLPSVQVQGGRCATFEYLDMRDNDILAMSGVATPKFETWTANSSTPYIVAYSDLAGGPVVLDVPPAEPEGSFYGQVVNAWQASIADIGPSGVDGGRGARILFTAPGYDGPVPAEYLHIVSTSYRIVMALRTVPGPGKTQSDAYAYARRLRMYPLSETADPPEQRFVDAVDTRYPTLLPYDERYTMADDQGRPLEAGATYRLTVPPDMPVKQFWSLSVYDRSTMAFIYTESMRTTLDSYGLDAMHRNSDGSVTLYVGPTAPEGLDENWIPTRGKRPMPTVRLYGPTATFYDGGFKLADFERMEA